MDQGLLGNPVGPAPAVRDDSLFKKFVVVGIIAILVLVFIGFIIDIVSERKVSDLHCGNSPDSSHVDPAAPVGPSAPGYTPHMALFWSVDGESVDWIWNDDGKQNDECESVHYVIDHIDLQSYKSHFPPGDEGHKGAWVDFYLDQGCTQEGSVWVTLQAGECRYKVMHSETYPRFEYLCYKDIGR